MSSQTNNNLSWYAIHTNPRQEDRAEDNLQAWGIETLVPRFKIYQLNPYTQRPSCLIKHLFPRYIFARFDYGNLVHKINYTRGIHSIVSFGNRPAQVHEAIIALLRSRMDSEGLVKISDEPQPGDEVTINDGPLKGLTGIFKQEVKENERVMILLDAISFQAHVVVDKFLIRKRLIGGDSRYVAR